MATAAGAAALHSAQTVLEVHHHPHPQDSPQSAKRPGTPGSVRSTAGIRMHMADFVEAACDQPEYGGFEIDGTFEDFAEVLIMYGYAVLFAAVYPPAPLLCAMLFIVELRVDGFKIFNIVQRPFPKRAASIGAWKSIVTTLSWLGAFSNALLLTYTFEVFKEVKYGDQPVPSGAAFFAFATASFARA